MDTGSQQPYDDARHAPTAGVPTWEEIVDRHSDRVYRLALRLTGNRHDAEDLTQEVFVRVFRSLSTYTPGTFEGWIHRITTNLFLDQARRKQRIRFDALSDERADRLHSDLPTPDTAYADTTFDDDIERALSTLPPEFRAAVVLCDVEGLSYEEIAADPRRQARHRPLPHPPRPRHAPHGARAPCARRRPYPLRRARAAAPGVDVVIGPVIGHLGPRVSALLDGQLSPADEERAWEHVHSCHQCRDAVEREGWVKTRLATMQYAGSDGAVPPQGLAALPGDRHRLGRPARRRPGRRRRGAAGRGATSG